VHKCNLPVYQRICSHQAGQTGLKNRNRTFLGELKNEAEDKSIPGIIKAGLEECTRMDLCKYCDVGFAKCLSPDAYLAYESGY
jgi:hypothetical protein